MSGVPLAMCCFAGVLNFFLHKAVIESGHPFIEDTKYYFGRHFGKNSSYIIEFVLLLAALGFASTGSWLTVLIYGAYTGFNVIAAWMLLTGKV